MATAPQFTALQKAYFEAADEERFAWTTSRDGLADLEEELLEPVIAGIEGPCLEIGCGEGNNLVLLTRHCACVGIDFSPAKIAFAASRIPAAQFAAADATRLPFGSGVFRTVFIRDLLHHIEHPADVLGEAVRVLATDGRLVVLEPNGRNPLIRLQTILVDAERGARRFNQRFVEDLFVRLPIRDRRVEARQPLPLRRLVLHYRMGLPALGRTPWIRSILVGVERVLGRLLPASRWTYISATAVRDAC